jgi:hypothetical protein
LALSSVFAEWYPNPAVRASWGDKHLDIVRSVTALSEEVDRKVCNEWEEHTTSHFRVAL